MRTLLFDIDGTLLTTGGGSEALRQAIAEQFDRPEACTKISYAGRTDRWILSQLLVRNDIEDTAENRGRLLGCYINALPQILVRHGGHVLPGVMPLVRRLAEAASFRLCVMTGNSIATARLKLRHFGLESFFTDVFGGDEDIDRNQMAARSHQHLRQRYGDDIESLVVIGDTPDDITCARAIGAKVVAVATGRFTTDQLGSHRPDCVLPSLADVDEVTQLLREI